MFDRPLVHIVDDEVAVRKSISFMLTASGYAVETWASGTAFAAQDDRRPGCVLLDVRMPGMDGLEAQQLLAERGARLPVIVMTGHGDISIAVRAMKAGAVDFIEKPFEKPVLIAAIETALARLRDIDAKDGRHGDAHARLAALTPRERDVLEGLAAGHANKAIARALGISPRTVEIHRANLMAKLGVRSFSDALRIAFAAGMGG